MTADDRPAFDEAAETMKNVIAGIRQWADDDVIAATDRLERAIVDFRKMVPEPAPARTAGQIAHEAYGAASVVHLDWASEASQVHAAWEAAAQAVISWHEQQQTESAPAPAPAWSPVVGGWAEHGRYGRVLVLDHDPSNGFEQWLVFRQRPSGEFERVWAEGDALSAPVPRVWESAEDVPEHVVVTDRYGLPWPGAGFNADDTEMGPFTELLPEGGVW